MALTLNVLTLAECLDHKVRDQRLQMVRIDLLEQRYLQQEVQAVDERLVLCPRLDYPHRVSLVYVEQITRLHCRRRSALLI